MAVKEKIIALTQDGMENFVHDYDDAHIYHNAMMAHDYYKDNKCFSYDFGDNFECWVSGNGEITINSGLGMLHGYQLEIEDPVVVQVDAGSTNGHKGYIVVEIERGIQTEQAQAFAFNSTISGEWPVLQKDDILNMDGNFQMAIAEYTVDTDKDITYLNNLDTTLVIGGGAGEPVDAYTKAESDAKYAVIAHTHAIADVTGLQGELDTKASTAIATTTTDGLLSAADKTKLDGLDGTGGGGGASTTDLITTKGMTSGIVDGTSLNTVLDDHEAKVDDLNHYVNKYITISSSMQPTDQLKLIKKGFNVQIIPSHIFQLGVTPAVDTLIYQFLPGERPIAEGYYFARSLDGSETVVLWLDANNIKLKFKAHYRDGVLVPQGEATGELYFDINYITNDLPASLQKPGPKDGEQEVIA